MRSQLPFAPGTRYDVILDLPIEVGAAVNVSALIGGGLPLVRIVTAGQPQVPPAATPALKLNPALPLGVRMQDALRPELVVEGGARLTEDQKLDFTGLDLASPWRVNGGTGSFEGKPLFSVKRGTPIVMAIDNRTAFVQPFHVHGHSFRLLHRSTTAGRTISSTPCRSPSAESCTSPSSPTIPAVGSFRRRCWSASTSGCGAGSR